MYAVLEEKATAATAHHNELSAQIKAAEKRMAEIAVLRTHIINYAKTREVYVAYRKAGYSKKFREEHEEEILLHQAAKNAFDEMGTLLCWMALLIWCEKNSSVAVLREKNCNRPAPQYGISSNRSCLPISLPPRRNGSRSDNYGKA